MAKSRRKKTLHYLFSDKHKDYIRRCKDNEYNVAEGAIRSGKTVDNVFAFAQELKDTPDRIHLASGSTVANAKLNIGDANGFGLEFIFRGQCKWGKYKDNEALIIRGPDTQGKTRIVIFAGGALANSFKKIRGNSYGMWIATEINLHHESFIKEAINRQAAAKKLKVFWDLNPDHPKAHIYVDHIDKYQKLHEKGIFPEGYNYTHFTLDDNLSLPAERREAIKLRYSPGSVWYQRDILGLRMAPEGLIYKDFAAAYNNQDGVNRYFLTKEQQPEKYMIVVLGIDFGGTGSKHAFVANGITFGFQAVHSLKSVRVEPDTPTQLNDDVLSFVRWILKHYGFITEIRVDSEAQVLIRGIRQHLQVSGLGHIPIKNARKGPIIDRINLTASLMAQGAYFYTEDAEELADSHATALWDSTQDTLVRLDDGTSDIDSQDAHEYTLERYTKALIQARRPMIDGPEN
jgi:PBSX family phage terminase large subunit